MQEWCMEHPWMTFFLISGAVNGVVMMIRALKGKD